ncbi:MAG TPA: C13 family peptidase [Caulobacteraceae bacterium]|nr:C13 family peptidase [Caulobacteraceae bacterium]
MTRTPALLVLILGAILALAPAGARAASPFSNWAAIVVAGDFHAAHTDNPTETFDNARRDVSVAFEQAGFSARNLREFSVRPDRYPDTRPLKSDPALIGETLHDLAAHATGGCLVYFTSHGAPQGVLVGDSLLPPGQMDRMITDACGKRPTVVIISACFSGVFVPALADSNRMILTAARPDRSSFGCSESDKYPYFDTCMLKVLPSSHDFAALGPAVQACVAERETETGVQPASEPQLLVGPGLRATLPLYAFGGTARGAQPNVTLSR